MSARELALLLEDLYGYIGIGAVTLFVASVSIVLTTGVRRLELPDGPLGLLLALSVAAAVFCGQESAVAAYFAPTGDVSCTPTSTSFICSHAGEITATFARMFGPLLVGLAVLTFSWLPKRLTFATRLVGALAAWASPWVVRGAYDLLFAVD